MDSKGSSQIGETLFAIEFGLRGSGPNTAKGLGKSQVTLSAKFAGEFVSLVTLPPLFAPPMEGDRNDGDLLPGNGLEPGILLPGFTENGREVPGEVEPSLILQ